MRPWKVKDSLELYNVEAWGKEYFSVSAEGRVLVTPRGPRGGAIDLYGLVSELEDRGLPLPLLIRFTEIVERRIATLAGAFQKAFKAYDFQGRYRGVYPIKVNQQAHLVADMVRFGRPHHLGLECGSKPELLVVLALLDDPEALIVCNGYKDEEYIETALLAQKLGRNPMIVVEQLAEIPLVLRVAERLGVKPRLGLRAKLSRPGKGRWQTSAGDHAKFGLSTAAIVTAVGQLEAAGQLDTLELLHFHIGSQVTAIRSFQSALREASRLYTELVRLGAPMGYFDVGGGLGVDYDGSRTSYESSVNYSETEYAHHVVAEIASACATAGVAHPNIVTETGRALVAHHSVLVFDVLGRSGHSSEGAPPPVAADAPQLLREMVEVFENVTSKNAQECWHDAVALREDALTAFTMGMLRIEDRAALERAYWQVLGRVREAVRTARYVPDELKALERALADIYFCNFSVFQSVPDAWAIDQLFSCMPIHRLDERPDRRAVLADITCDSDGKLDRFIDLREVRATLELHALREGEPYLLGIFLVGAYQEILGDLHNLFGDTHAVHVSLDGDDGYVIDHVQEGDTVADVLSHVQYQPRDLLAAVRRASEDALRNGRGFTRQDARLLLRHYREALDGYTYLEGDEEP